MWVKEVKRDAEEVGITVEMITTGESPGTHSETSRKLFKSFSE